MTAQTAPVTLVVTKTAYGRSQHWYKIGDGPLLPSVTAILGVLHNWAIVNAAAKEVALAAVAQRRRLFALAEAHEPSAVQFFEGAHWIPWNAKKDLGIEVHATVLAASPPSEEAAPYVAQYHQWLTDSGAEVIAQEIEVASLVYGYGGKLDLLVRLDGRCVVVDLKVRDDLRVFPERLVQVAAYAAAEIGMPCVVDGAAVLTLGPDAYGWEEVPNLEAAMKGFLGLRAWAEYLGKTERSE